MNGLPRFFPWYYRLLHLGAVLLNIAFWIAVLLALFFLVSGGGPMTGERPENLITP